MSAISRVLCPVDFSDHSARVAAHAVAIARWYDARVTLLHIWVNQASIELPPLVLGETERTELLDELRHLAEPHHGVPFDFLVREASDVHQEILNQAETLSADLLVVGSHGRSGIGRLLLGSITEKLLRKATCPVMIVPHHAADVAVDRPPRFERILCPVDFSDSSLRAVTTAMELAQESNATLTLMHAIEIPPELSEYMPPSDVSLEAIRAAAVAASLTRLRDLVPDSVRTFCTVETTVVEGAAYRHILAVAAERQTDLIVMGVHGRGAIDLLVFGSNTARVTRAATCPVLVVPGGR